MVVHSKQCFFAKTPYEQCVYSMGCEAAIASEHYLDSTTPPLGALPCDADHTTICPPAVNCSVTSDSRVSRRAPRPGSRGAPPLPWWRLAVTFSSGHGRRQRPTSGDRGDGRVPSHRPGGTVHPAPPTQERGILGCLPQHDTGAHRMQRRKRVCNALGGKRDSVPPCCWWWP